MKKTSSDGNLFRGLIVPLVTPLHPDGAVDHDSLGALVEHVLEGGADGIFVLGTTGEFQYLDPDERLRAIETAKSVAGERCPVQAGVTGLSVEETIFHIARLKHLPEPPDAVVVAPLVYHSNRKLIRHLERLTALSHCPVYLYNNIGIVHRRWHRKDIMPELAENASRLENCAGFKDSSGNRSYFREIISRCAGPGFNVFQGVEKMMADSLAAGASGVVAGTANAFPRLFSELYRNCLSGQKKKADQLQKIISGLAELYDPPAIIPLLMKEYLFRRGVISSSFSFLPRPENFESIFREFTARAELFTTPG